MKIGWVVAALALGGCPYVQQLQQAAGGFQKPSVTYRDAVLVQAPSQGMMAAYYCPRVVPDPFGVPGGAAAMCGRALGAAPSLEALRVSFDLRFAIHNPNNFPVPLAELLTAVTVLPGQTSQSLGAVCVKLCPAGDAACSGAPDASSCKASSRDIRSIDDFARAAGDLLVSFGLTLAAGERPTFVMPQVAAAGDLDVTVRFSFGPQALVTVLTELARQAASDLKAGRAPAFQIPYQLEGSLWLDAGSLGRVAASFGPATGTWAIPTAALVP